MLMFSYYVFIPIVGSVAPFKDILYAWVLGLLITATYLAGAMLYVVGIIFSLYKPKSGLAVENLFAEHKDVDIVTIVPWVFALVVLCFSFLYLFLGNNLVGTFDINEIGFFDALYFSFSTMTVGPSGLTPVSLIAKLIVMFQIAVGLMFAVAIFSGAIDYLAKKNAK